MKKILLLLCMLLAVSTVDAQDLKFYIDVNIAPSNILENGVDALVDLGTGTEESQGYLKVGNKVAFESPMEIVNYFAGKGWSLAHVLEMDIGLVNSAALAIATGIKAEYKYPHYIFEKEAGSLEEAVADINLLSYKEMKKQKKEQRKEKARERDRTRSDDMYY